RPREGVDNATPSHPPILPPQSASSGGSTCSRIPRYTMPLLFLFLKPLCSSRAAKPLQPRRSSPCFSAHALYEAYNTLARSSKHDCPRSQHSSSQMVKVSSAARYSRVAALTSSG